MEAMSKLDLKKKMVHSKKNISFILFLAYLVFYFLFKTYLKYNSGDLIEFRSNYAFRVQVVSHIFLFLVLIYGIVYNYKKLYRIILLTLLFLVTYFLIDDFYQVMSPW